MGEVRPAEQGAVKVHHGLPLDSPGAGRWLRKASRSAARSCWVRRRVAGAASAGWPGRANCLSCSTRRISARRWASCSCAAATPGPVICAQPGHDAATASKTIMYLMRTPSSSQRISLHCAHIANVKPSDDGATFVTVCQVCPENTDFRLQALQNGLCYKFTL